MVNERIRLSENTNGIIVIAKRGSAVADPRKPWTGMDKHMSTLLNAAGVRLGFVGADRRRRQSHPALPAIKSSTINNGPRRSTALCVRTFVDKGEIL